VSAKEYLLGQKPFWLVTTFYTYPEPTPRLWESSWDISGHKIFSDAKHSNFLIFLNPRPSDHKFGIF
jgi:hypothetical protein